MTNSDIGIHEICISIHHILYGHSAGGQFVHRLVLFMPEARYQRAIAANPGFYTFPTPDVAYPYGMEGTPLQTGISNTVFERNFVLMLGTKDTNRHNSVLRKTPQADRQGVNRFERGRNYFKAAQEVAQRGKAKFNWQLVEVPGVGHSDVGMAQPAATILFG
jgi:pimeloyl-ACP methyl ester carboxylesterase